MSKKTVEWSFSFDDLNQKIQNAFAGKFPQSADTQTSNFSAPLDGATSAKLHLGIGAGALTCKTLSESANLIEVEATHVGELHWQVEGAAERSVTLEQKTSYHDLAQPIKEFFGTFSNRDDLRWNVALKAGVEWVLDVDCGVGSSALDLRETSLARLDLDGGVGGIKLALPSSEKVYHVSLDTGVGGAEISFEPGAAAKVVINSGVGGVKLQLPEGAAVRLKIASGVGSAKLPERFVRVEGGVDFIAKVGAWETEGYGLATHHIEIEYNGGVGGLEVK